MRSFLALLAGFHALFAFTLACSQPKHIYGVNLGSWLLIEPWMLPDEWIAMGGQNCTNCQDCIRSEFDLTKANPNTADQIFDKHWQTWFTQADVQRLKELGINTVRIPLGYWIVEPLVEEGEFYPKGGFRRLKEGLKWLKDAGIAVILDHHALPGVAAENQMFAGRCTSDVQFYTPKNYHRALIWTAVITVFSHIDPSFGSVFSIQAANEVLMDASRTPGYGQFQKDFVQTVRAVEGILGVGSKPNSTLTPPGNITDIFQKAAGFNSSDVVKSVLKDSVPVLLQTILKYGSLDMVSEAFRPGKKALTTNFMDILWQHNGAPNPADAKDGPQVYDDHLYYSFGGVADPNPKAYLTHICNLDKIKRASEANNTPLWFGEWSIATNFNATDDFMKQWADAQKLQYSKSSGWIFWNFKLEDSENAGVLRKQWSYYKAVELGYLTKDPAAYHDPNVCAPYINTTTTNTTVPNTTPTNTTVLNTTPTNTPKTNTTVPDTTPTNTPKTNTTVPDTTPTNTLVPDTTPTNTPVPDTTLTNTPVPDKTPTDTPVPDKTPTNAPVPDKTPTDTNVPYTTPTDNTVPDTTGTGYS